MELQPRVMMVCPVCAEPVSLLVRLESVRLEDTEQGQRLYPKISAGSVLHACRPRTIT
jgi:hypothetical protein